MNAAKRKNFKKHVCELSNKLKLELDTYAPKLNVFLKRLGTDMTVPVSVFIFKSEICIYDLFADVEFTMKDYGKKWALYVEDCLWGKK